MKKKTPAVLPALILALSLLLTACGGTAANTANTENTAQPIESGDNTETKDNSETKDSNDNTDNTDTAVPGSADVTGAEADADDSGYEFSDRDLDPSYDQLAATVTLADGATSVSGSGVTVAGDDITVTAAGTYLFTGALTDGSITVAAGEEDKVQLILDGVSVTNADGPAVYVRSADKVFLTLADGSDNTLADGPDAAATDGDKELDGAVYSCADLTVNGSGSLTVLGNSKHGVVSKDDLVITAGSLTPRVRGWSVGIHALDRRGHRRK